MSDEIASASASASASKWCPATSAVAIALQPIALLAEQEHNKAQRQDALIKNLRAELEENKASAHTKAMSREEMIKNLEAQLVEHKASAQSGEEVKELKETLKDLRAKVKKQREAMDEMSRQMLVHEDNMSACFPHFFLIFPSVFDTLVVIADKFVGIATDSEKLPDLIALRRAALTQSFALKYFEEHEHVAASLKKEAAASGKVRSLSLFLSFSLTGLSCVVTGEG